MEILQTLKFGSRVLFYLPYTGVTERAQLEFALIRELSRKGIQVDLLRCRGGLPGPCAVKRSIHGEVQKLGKFTERVICVNCQRAAQQLSELPGVTSAYIEDFLTAEDLARLEKLQSSVLPNCWSDFVYRNLPIGRYAAYVPLIRANAAGPADLVLDWERYLSELKACLFVAEATSKLVNNQDYDLLVAFGGLYGPDRTFLRIAEQHRVPVIVLEGSALAQEQTSALHSYYSDEKYFHVVFSQYWKDWKSKPLSNLSAQRAFNHHKALTESSSPLVYSSLRNPTSQAEDILQHFQIPSGSKVVVFTVSSPDEEVAREYSGDEMPVIDRDSVTLQLDCVEQLRRYVQTNPSTYLVIRLHPRLFKARSRRTDSPSLAYYSKLASDNSQNVRFNTPDQNISLYDLIQIADVGVTHQSSTALEFLAFGLPVVVGGQTFTTCPHDLVRVPYDQHSLHQHLTEALFEEASIQRSMETFRWWGFVSHFNRVLHISVENEETARSSGDQLISSSREARHHLPKLKKYLPQWLATFAYSVTAKHRLRAKPTTASNVIELLNSVIQRRDYLVPESSMSFTEEQVLVHEHLRGLFATLNYQPTEQTKIGRFYQKVISDTSSTGVDS